MKKTLNSLNWEYRPRMDFYSSLKLWTDWFNIWRFFFNGKLPRFWILLVKTGHMISSSESDENSNRLKPYGYWNKLYWSPPFSKYVEQRNGRSIIFNGLQYLCVCYLFHIWRYLLSKSYCQTSKILGWIFKICAF